MINKHGEFLQSVSPSGKFEIYFQMQYCGNSKYVIVKNNNNVVFAQYDYNGCTYFPSSKWYFEQDDTLIEFQQFFFIEVNKILFLVDEDGTDWTGQDPMLPDIVEQFNSCPSHTCNRTIKRIHNRDNIDLRTYQPYGHETEVNNEFVIISEEDGPIFARWKKQDCAYIVTDNYTDRPPNSLVYNLYKYSWEKSEKGYYYSFDSSPQYLMDQV